MLTKTVYKVHASAAERASIAWRSLSYKYTLVKQKGIDILVGARQTRSSAPLHDFPQSGRHKLLSRVAPIHFIIQDMPVSDAWMDFIGGWCSGASAVIALQPVDTILTRWQAGVLTNSGHQHQHRLGWSVAAAKDLTVTAGWGGLWRGASPMITAVPFQNALLMGGYGVGLQFSETYGSSKHTAIFWGGCVGGVIQSFLMSPVELVKVSQQVGTTRQILHQTFKSSAWRGLGATLLRDGIPHGVWFVSYEMAKESLTQECVNNGTDGSFTVPPLSGPVVPLLSGAFAATVAWGVGYPADLIKTRLQANPNGPGIMATGQQIVAESGWVGLYRGFGLKLVRAIPASMIGFTVYEFVKGQLEQL